METNNPLSKEYFEGKYKNAPYGILVLSPDGTDVIYANLAATASLGCMLNGTTITGFLASGWQKMLEEARNKKSTTFIPFKEQDVFTYLRATPIIREKKVVGFLGNTVSAVESPGISMIPIEYMNDENHYLKLITTLEAAMNEVTDKATLRILERMHRNALKLYNHRRDYVEFIVQNYFLQKEDKTVFSLLSVLLLVSKNAFRIDLNKTAMLRADTLYIRGRFEIYRIMLEEIVYFMLTQTRDTSPITASVDFYDGRITLTLFKRGTMAKAKSVSDKNNKTATPPPMIQLMSAILIASNVNVDFDMTEDAIIATVSMDYVMGNAKPQYTEDNVTPVNEETLIQDEFLQYEDEEYEDYYIDT